MQTVYFMAFSVVVFYSEMYYIYRIYVLYFNLLLKIQKRSKCSSCCHNLFSFVINETFLGWVWVGEEACLCCISQLVALLIERHGQGNHISRLLVATSKGPETESTNPVFCFVLLC